MKKAILAITVAIVIQSLCIPAVRAQETAAGPGLVAVLDVVRVFNENADHAQKMDQIRQKAESVKTTIEQKFVQLQDEAKEAMKLEQNTAQRNQVEAQLEQRQAAIKTEARQQETDLLTEEARVYFQTWNKLQQVIGQVASHNNISLVLRYDSASIDPENRNDVIKGVNRSVIYHDRLDITDLVIQQMGPSTANAAAPNGIQQK